MAGVAVIIPALDEAAIIGRVVTDLMACLPEMSTRIVVVDNGSTDDTAAKARQAGAEVVREPRRGYGRACAAGVAATAGAEYLVFLDGDGADSPADLERVLAPVLSGTADLVVGVRVVREARSMTPWQRAGNRLAAFAIRLIYGARVSDLGPFRAIRRADLIALRMTEMTYGWPSEMLVRSLRARLRYREVDVSYRRRTGVSKVGGTLAGSLRAAWCILRVAVVNAAWQPPEATHSRPESQ